jgi:Domain of Unknown Function (DUF1080)
MPQLSQPCLHPSETGSKRHEASGRYFARHQRQGSTRTECPCIPREKTTPSRHVHPTNGTLTKETPMKRAFALFSFLGMMVLAAAASGADDKAGAKDNTPPEGFTALFNGKDLTGWQAAIRIDQRLKMDGDKLAAAQKKADEKALPHWKVEKGVLVNDGQGGNLATMKQYANIELYVDWMIEPKGDSGIYLRGEPQVQIWDSDSLDPNKYKLELSKGSGALWNNANPKDKVPLKNADKKPGEWNKFYIVMKGDKVSIKLNGELVVDNVALENIWEKGKPLPAKGPIELQQHPKQDGKFGEIKFKNIYVKELPD